MVEILNPQIPQGGLRGIAKEGAKGVAGVVFTATVVGLGLMAYGYLKRRAIAFAQQKKAEAPAANLNALFGGA